MPRLHQTDSRRYQSAAIQLTRAVQRGLARGFGSEPLSGSVCSGDRPCAISAIGVCLTRVEFVHLPTFTRSARKVLDEADLFELELALVLWPAAGDLIPGARGLRKLRRPGSGRGKRGGVRVIYYLVGDQDRIYLVFAYAKNRSADLTSAQLSQLAAHVALQLP